MDSLSFMPHGACVRWDVSLLVRQVLGDGLTALAYFSIPLAIFRTVRGRENWGASPILVMFALFILFCGGGHLWDIVNVWVPWYSGRASWGLFGTALMSCVTAWVVIRRLPQFLASLSYPLNLSAIIEKSTALEIENSELRSQLRKHQSPNVP